MKEQILKVIEDLKSQKTKVLKGKHASPKEIIDLINKIDTKIDRQLYKLKELDKK